MSHVLGYILVFVECYTKINRIVHRDMYSVTQAYENKLHVPDWTKTIPL